MAPPQYLDPTCAICRKHAGQGEQPPGGYVFEDDQWLAAHADPGAAVPGQLTVESRRHFLDFADMSVREAASYGWLLKLLTAALRQATGTERVYHTALTGTAPHFHAHLIPHPPGFRGRGLDLLAGRHACAPAEAAAAAARLRAAVEELA